MADIERLNRFAVRGLAVGLALGGGATIALSTQDSLDQLHGLPRVSLVASLAIAGSVAGLVVAALLPSKAPEPRDPDNPYPPV
jgi:hypothetical protein